MDFEEKWKAERERAAFLALDDGTVFRGVAFGARKDGPGEVVFNTGMTGYQEILTDPSYAGQFVALTTAEVGNYGVNDEDPESRGLFLSGLVVGDLAEPSNWRSTRSLDDYLKANGVPGIRAVDTRRLALHIREHGNRKAWLCAGGPGKAAPEALEKRIRTAIGKAKAWEGLDGQDYAAKVTCAAPYDFTATSGAADAAAPLVAVYDFGVKANILRSLAAWARVRVFPAKTPAEELLALKPDGVFLSNGPADPAALPYAIENIRKILGLAPLDPSLVTRHSSLVTPMTDGPRPPVMGICLGHQLLALACGAKTGRLKFGHHGCNHPVKNLATGKVQITSQNHNFTVLAESLPDCLEVTHLNLNDGTIEGLRHRTLPAFSVQYHPEACPGPHDAAPLFDRFRATRRALNARFGTHLDSNNQHRSTMAKYVFITGGVVSSLGKGVTSASLALLLKSRGYSVFMQKLDPYLNVDPGTMSPYQHGEVFVTDDGAETDLDLGHYERFAGVTCSKASNYTSGRIYAAVLARERAGGYLGGTVQVVPHVTDEIKAAIRSAGEAHGAEPAPDVVLCEIGGVSGDIESLPFLEAARQFRFEAGPGNACFVHLTLVPYLKAAGELKTKPSQHSVGQLRAIGIIPDVLVCRTERTIPPEHLDKLALFCNVRRECVVEEKDVAESVYAVPRELREQGLDARVLEILGLPVRPIRHTVWDTLVRKATQPKRACRIALVGKYVAVRDAYKSVHEALQHAGMARDARVEVVPIEAETLEGRGRAAVAARRALAGFGGILIPGGFGARGVEGKIAAIRYARENKVPLLGICLGMQCAVIEFARHVAGWADAHSAEFEPATKHPVIDLMESQRGVTQKGGTMRLGAYPCLLKKGSLAAKLYGSSHSSLVTRHSSLTISERHRHRYEFAAGTEMQKALAAKGLVPSGLSPDGRLVETVELPGHPYFVACQFHPEFKSRPAAPHPLFLGLVTAALARKSGTPPRRARAAGRPGR